MKKNIVLGLLLSFAVSALAQDLKWRLDSLMQDSLLLTAQAGVMVWDLTADSVVYEHGARQLLRPASTMKVLTAVSAIDVLGGDYRLSTSLYYSGTLNGHTLDGDLCLVGGMDPMFDTDDMDALVENVRRLGIDTLRGRLVADLSMKESKQYGEGWCWDDDNYDLTPLRMGRRLDVAEQLGVRLQKGGVVLPGGVLTARERLPRQATFVCARTHTIDQVLREMMKESNNLYAESMFYQTAAKSGHRPATADDGRRQERQVMQRAGLLPQHYRIADGSGLSLYNYLSAEALTMLLRYAWFDDRIYSHLLPSLPVAGQDGTLKKRMIGTSAENNVQAKTGTVTGISSLAGYLTAANGHRLCFAIIVQGLLRAAEGRDFQDRMCAILCE